MNSNEEKGGYRLGWDLLRKDWPLLIIMAGLLVAGVLLYPKLPSQVPSHWNFRGEVDAYASRAFGAFFAPVLSVAVYAFMVVLPVFDPQRRNYGRFAGAYRLLRWGLVLYFSFLYIVTVSAGLGYPVDISLVVKIGVSVLLILIGNLMGQLRHNYFVGIKTPWTLASEAVWVQTHRLAAKVWVLGGLICLAMSPVQTLWSAGIFFSAIAVMVIVPIVVSFLLFRRINPS